MESKIMNPWIPMECEENGNNITTTLWGRKYISGEKSFLQSIISQGQEILAGPVRLVGTENGKELEWGDFTNLLMNNSNEELVSIVSAAQSDSFVLNVSMNIEYDGFIDLALTLAPQGTRPGKVFGIDINQKPEYILSRLWLEIPIKPDVAKLYHVFPNGPLTINGKFLGEHSAFRQAGELADDIKMEFKQQIFIGNDDVGIAVLSESDEGRQIEDEKKAIECIRKGDEYVLRIRLLDSEPYSWREKGIGDGMYNWPITYKMGFTATPLRPFPENPYEERAVHIDCFKKIPNDMLYDEFLLSSYEDTDELVIDRIKRLGVTTLYLHEKWNDLQNSPFLTKRTADKVKLIIEEAHKRDIKLIPYFGYEISSLSPYWSKLGEKVSKKMVGDNMQWFRYPAQRDPRVCFNSEWKDIFFEGIMDLYDEFDFDGLYLDSTVFPWPCANEKHGCGYRDKDGKLHNTYTLWSTRDLMKKLYKMISKRGGVLNNHSCSSLNLSSMSFCNSLWEGETIQQPLMLGEVTKLPEEYFRAVINGRKFGVPVNMLCYSNPPVWTFSKALSQAVLFGCLPKPNDVGEPLEEMSSIWKIFDEFGFDNNTSWHYYFNNDEIISSNDNVKISYYKNADKYLVICSNVLDEEVKTNIAFREGEWNLLSSINVTFDILDGKNLTDTFGGFGYKIILLEAK